MFGGDEGDSREDPYERQLRLHRERENASKSVSAPALVTVVTSLPGLPEGWSPPATTQHVNPNKVWNDKVTEPELPIEPTVCDTQAPLFEQQKGQCWWVKLPGGITLIDVEILDITLKTVRVESSNRFVQPARYARSDIEFIEQINA